MEDNYINKLQQKLANQALYCKNGAALFIRLYGQLHSDIVTIVKRSTIPLLATVHKERDVVGLLFIFRSIYVQNLTGSKVDPYLEQLKILSSTLSYVKIKWIFNHDFGDAVYDQVFAAKSQCGTFAFEDNYHAKVLSDDGFSDFKGYLPFDETKKDKYEPLARELVCSGHIINNSISSKTCIYLKKENVVYQSNYLNTVVEAVVMITSTWNDDADRDLGNKNTKKNPKGIVSIHLANCGNNCWKPDNDGAAVLFEFIANDRGTTDHDDLPGVEAPAIDSEFGHYNINENVENVDDDDGNDDDNNDDTIMSGNNIVDNSVEGDSVPDNDNTDSSNPTYERPAWMSLQVVADNDDNNDPDDYDEFRSDLDLDDDGVFDNDNTGQGEGSIVRRWLIFCILQKMMNIKMMISYYTMVYSILVVT